MYKRKDYMSGKITHRQYYTQFVNDNVKNMIIDSIGLNRLVNSKDEYFNDIPLELWDIIGLPGGIVDKINRAGDYYSLAGQVCILKEAARQLRENNIKKL